MTTHDMRGRHSAQPTIKDVARVAGVSFKTVSRVVNDEPGVSVVTRQLVRQALDELGYARNEAAASLRRGSSGSEPYL